MTPPGRKTRFAGVLVNLALAASSLSLSLVAAEAGVRLLTRTGPSLLVADLVVGKRFVAGFAPRHAPECTASQVRTQPRRPARPTVRRRSLRA
jgi:hypothetical protein